MIKTEGFLVSQGLPGREQGTETCAFAALLPFLVGAPVAPLLCDIAVVLVMSLRIGTIRSILTAC